MLDIPPTLNLFVLPDQAETMLLCDSCDAGFHTSCLSPKLETVPEGDWFCAACTAAGKEKARHAEDMSGAPPPLSAAGAAAAPQEDPLLASPSAALSASSDEEEEEQEEESDWSAASDDDEKAVWKPRARKRQVDPLTHTASRGLLSMLPSPLAWGLALDAVNRRSCVRHSPALTLFPPLRHSL